ncbi:MAG: ATP-dependent helicase [Clostridiales bacterium]|nr:ATP-dependent helicase [Clostridiales bacterium]MCF8023283.1 ATP-dependent helicase [Clostridiales bacterium]
MNEQFYLEGLNKKQKDAVLAPLDKPLKVTAGAGTGKTRMLTSRYSRCLEENPEWTPDNLLALTFTEKAASEMKGRINTLCRNHNFLYHSGTMLDACIGTFHSICSRITRENSLILGLDPQFAVLTELESKIIFNEVLDKVLDLKIDMKDIDLYSFTQLPFTELPAKSSDIYKVIQELKDSFLEPEEFLDTALNKLNEFTCKYGKLPEKLEQKKIHGSTKKAIKSRLENLNESVLLEKEWIYFIYLVYREYQNSLYRLDSLDFADLIFTAYKLCRDYKEIRKSYCNQFKHIFVDEFQDTSLSQFKLLSILAVDDKMSNVTVVGDEKQCIYTWRNARPENMADFKVEKWGGKEVILKTNYRSCKGILDCSHYTVAQEEPFKSRKEEIRLEPGREDARQGELHVRICLKEEEAQAEIAAAQILDLIKNGSRPGDIAILFRSLKHSKPFEDALRKRGIHYTISGGTGFYERVEIKDLLAYLKLINDPADRNSLLWVLMRPPVGLSDHQIYQLANAWEQQEGKNRRLDVYEALFLDVDKKNLDSDTQIKLKRLKDLLNNSLVLRSSLSAATLLDYILEESGYLQFLYTRPYNEVIHSMNNLNKLRTILADFENRQEVTGLDDIINLLEIYQGNEEQEVDSAEENAVQVMTVHKSKGLEYKYVFVAQVTPGRFPFSPKSPYLAWHKKLGLLIIETVKYGNIFSESQLKVLNEFGLLNYKNILQKESLEEDRRVFYVALSRAEDRLYILSTEPRPKVSSKLQNYYEELKSAVHEGYLDNKYCSLWERKYDNYDNLDSTAVTQNKEDLKIDNVLTWPKERQELKEGNRVSLSFTKLNLYRKCPRKYYFKYAVGIPENEFIKNTDSSENTLNLDAGILGNIVHNSIQSYELCKFGVEKIEEAIKEEAFMLGVSAEGYESRYKKTAVKAFQNYIKLATDSSTENVFIEKEFHAQYIVDEGELDFNGFIDRLEISGERIKIIDFKTNLELTPEKIELYSLQLNLYACGLKRVLPHIKQFTLELWHLIEGKIIEIKNDQVSVEKELLYSASAILRGKYPPNKGKECSYCSYSFICHEV